MLLRTRRKGKPLLNPADLGDLLLWADPSGGGNVTLDGTLVDAVADLSGNDYHLASSGGARPTLLTASSPTGLDMLDFAGAQRLINTSVQGAAGFVSVVVCSLDSDVDDSNASTILDSYDSSLPTQVYRGKTGDQPSNAGAPRWAFRTDQGVVSRNVAGLGDGELSIITAARSAGFPNEIRIRRYPDATFAGEGNGNIGTGVLDGIVIGNIRGASPIESDYGHRGRIGEVLVYGQLLGPVDLQRLWHHLRLKWGVTPP